MPDAPAPAPAAPAAPTPPTTAPGPGGHDSPFYADFDAIDKADRSPAPKKEGKESPPTAKPSSYVKAADSTAKPQKQSGKEDADSKEDGTTANAPTEPESKAAGAVDKPPVPVKAAELRNAYENLKREHKALKEEHEKVKSAKPPEDPEKKTLLETLKAREARLKELEEEVKFTSYEKSEEFKKTYHEPYNDAYQAGRERATSLTVTDAEGNERAGAPADFDAIMAAPSEKAAIALAKELFGEGAPMMLFQRETVKDILRRANKAKEDFRSTAEQRSKELAEKQALQKAETEKRQAEMSASFKRLNDEAVEKYPHYFKPEEGDEKGNELLQKGFAFADMAFNLPPNTAPEKAVQIHSVLRNKAAGFDRLAYRLKTALDKAKELQAKIDEYEKSAPTGGVDRRGAAPGVLSIDDEIAALDK